MKQEILKSLLEKINAYGLHEAVRTRLTEQTGEVIVTTIFLPMKKDQNGKLQYSETSSIKFTATASPTPGVPGSTTHDRYKNFAKLFINGVSVGGFKSTKDATTGNISGIFFADKETFKYLKDKVGKAATPTSDVYFSVNLDPAGTEAKYAMYTVKTYEVPVTATPK